MANKQSIQDIAAALDRWHRKLNMCVTKINELRDKKKKIIKGYVKHPEPNGVKIMIKDIATKPDCNDDLSDIGGGYGGGFDGG